MTLTLLLDLDGTLLDNEIDGFVASYTQALAQHMAPYVESGFLIKTLMAATQSMLQRQRPEATLQESFDEAFYPRLGMEKTAIQGKIDEFYAEVFPTLRPQTRMRPEAVQLVEEAFAHGYQVGIATNPLFPLTAIVQRLSWAGLSPERYPFVLIPSYETFHFAKPNPAFFAEFLGSIGWPEGPVVMVGNELDLDIAGACLMGIKSFYVTSESTPANSSPYAPSAYGPLADILPWLESTPFEALLPNYSIPSALLATLRATPATLGKLIARLPPSRWAVRPQPGDWSLVEILCHLRDVENEVNLPRIQKTALETNPFLPGMDTDPWAESRRYIQQDGDSALRSYTTARGTLLALLDNLSPAGWQRPAQHAIFGPTTLIEIVSIVAGHDRLHIQQIDRLIHQISG